MGKCPRFSVIFILKNIMNIFLNKYFKRLNLKLRIVYIDNNNSLIQKVNFQILKKLGYLNENDVMIFKNSKQLSNEDINHIIKNSEIIFCENNLGLDISGIDFLKSISSEYKGKMALMIENAHDFIVDIMDISNKIECINYKSSSHSLQIKTIKRLGEIITEHKLKRKNNE